MQPINSWDIHLNAYSRFDDKLMPERKKFLEREWTKLRVAVTKADMEESKRFEVSKKPKLAWAALFVLIGLMIGELFNLWTADDAAKSVEIAKQAEKQRQLDIKQKNPGYKEFYLPQGNRQIIKRLQALHKFGYDLDGVNASCQAIGEWSIITDKCEQPPNLSGLRLFKIGVKPVLISYASFEHAIVDDATFNFGVLRHTNFNFAKIRSVNFTHADLTGASFVNVDFDDVNLVETNISSANFEGAVWLQDNMLAAAWAWADKKPRFVDNLTHSFRLCDPALRDTYERYSRHGIPMECR